MENISDEGLGERVPISESKKRGFLKEEFFPSRGSTVRRGLQGAGYNGEVPREKLQGKSSKKRVFRRGFQRGGSGELETVPRRH